MLIPIFFEFLLYENMIWFFLETWPYAWRQNIFFLTKTRYFNIGFISLQYKNTNQYWSKYNKKYTGKSQIFWKQFFIFWAGPDPAHPFWAGPALPSPVNKNKQWRTLHCSHATWTVEQPGRGRRRRREVEAYLAVVRSCGSWSCRLYAVGRWFYSFSVLFFLCSFFSPRASVSCFSFSSSTSNGGDVVVDGGLRWHWWLQTMALLCGGGQCLLLFFPSVQRRRLLLLLHGCCSRGRKMVRSWRRGTRLWWQTLLLFLLTSASPYCLFPLYFVSPVNSFLASLQWLRGGVAGASGAVGCGEEEDGWW